MGISGSQKTGTGTLGVLLLLACIYTGAGKLGLSMAFLNASASPVWPPTGLALAAALLFGNRVWPAILLGAFVVNVTTEGTPAIVAVGIAVGNTIEALLGAILARRLARGREAFDRGVDVLRFICYAVIPSTVASAAIGVTCLALAGGVAWESYPAVWITWWTGNFVSDLVIAPLLIVWAAPVRWSWEPKRIVEATLLTVLLVVASAVILGRWHMFDWANRTLPYMTMPLVFWAAFRFQQRGAVIATAIMSTVAIHGALRGTGPFIAGSANDSLLLLQAFMGVESVTALVLAAVVTEGERDRAEKKVLLERERAARGEAERANQAKDEFLAILSHELRTPLTPVLLTASLLEQSQELPEWVREDARAIRGNVELEARLIEDLLDLTRIARGKLKLNSQYTDVHAAVRQAAELSCRDRAQNLTLDLSADRHVVHGDPVRLQQVFWNLLNNAVKFTPAGRPITVRSYNANGAKVCIEVEDAGVGIDPTVMPRLFRAFEQADTSPQRKYGGLGLGLAITKALVESQGGGLTAQSAGVNQGATFTVEFPTSDVHGNGNDAPVKAALTRPSGARAPRRVLLVEDHQDTRDAMKRILTILGCEVVTAGTVATALEAARASPIDLVISDIGLPDGSGHELMRGLRRGLKAPGSLKGIALSGYGMDEDLRMSREAGFVAHLTKPVDLKELEAAIRRAME